MLLDCPEAPMKAQKWGRLEDSLQKHTVDLNQNDNEDSSSCTSMKIIQNCQSWKAEAKSTTEITTLSSADNVIAIKYCLSTYIYFTVIETIQ